MMMVRRQYWQLRPPAPAGPEPDKPGFMDAFIDRVKKRVDAYPFDVFGYRPIRSRLGIDPANRSECIFLSKALGMLVDRGDITLLRDTPGNRLYKKNKGK